MSRTIVFALICGFFAAFVLANPQYAEAEEEVPQPEVTPTTFPVPEMTGEILLGNSEVVTTTSIYDDNGFFPLVIFGSALSTTPNVESDYQYLAVAHTFGTDLSPYETTFQFYTVKKGEFDYVGLKWEIQILNNDGYPMTGIQWFIKEDEGEPCFDGYRCRRGQITLEAPHVIPADQLGGLAVVFYDKHNPLITYDGVSTLVGLSLNGTLAPWPPEAETFNIYLPLVVR